MQFTVFQPKRVIGDPPKEPQIDLSGISSRGRASEAVNEGWRGEIPVPFRVQGPSPDEQRRISFITLCLGRELEPSEQRIFLQRSSNLKELMRDANRQRLTHWTKLSQEDQDRHRNTPVHCVGEGIYVGTDQYIVELVERPTKLMGYPEGFHPDMIITLSGIAIEREQEFSQVLGALDIKHVNVPVEDSEKGFYEGFAPQMGSTLKTFCESYVKGDQILVHCHLGISRSPTIVAAFLGLILDESFFYSRHLVQARRPQIQFPIERCGEEYEERQGEKNFMCCAAQSMEPFRRSILSKRR